MRFSVVTLVKGRKRQLENLLESIKAGSLIPDEIVVVWMETPTPQSHVTDTELNLKQVYIEDAVLPLAEARNVGFQNTSFENIVFLDVDCICSPTVLENLLAHVTDNTIISAYARYLPYMPLKGNYPLIAPDALTHPKRAELSTFETLPHKKFWSLVFALKRKSFNLIGGFDEGFTGYGGEDTDFAERFNAMGFAFMLVKDEVLHQYHLKYTPPLNYLSEIVHNANRFFSKHNYFPMYSWLQHFCDRGFVAFNENKHQFDVICLPSQSDITNALSTQPY
ncbi:glycosyltransferase [Alteromonas sp. 345S023]|uniref:Glycosyltransferase n=1 Tax=Alteromonas profundi TaxID=2696062 RepID=A0A7X5LND6_9ALTE|nr:galactosyltransferase-related protein [Alteromonas profundi]NDV92561.1 glycosyltransferase [Alteromonas profundi]